MLMTTVYLPSKEAWQALTLKNQISATTGVLVGLEAHELKHPQYSSIVLTNAALFDKGNELNRSAIDSLHYCLADLRKETRARNDTLSIVPYLGIRGNSSEFDLKRAYGASQKIFGSLCPADNSQLTVVANQDRLKAYTHNISENIWFETQHPVVAFHDRSADAAKFQRRIETSANPGLTVDLYNQMFSFRIPRATKPQNEL